LKHNLFLTTILETYLNEKQSAQHVM